MNMISATDKAKNIHLCVFDIDGVFTNGRIYYSANGDELKGFNILDGLGIKLLDKAGIKSAVITGRRSALVERRVTELGIDYLYQGREDKLTALKELLSSLSIPPEQVAYMGDDLPDLSAMNWVKLGITVPNGCNYVRQHADWCTQLRGGEGAVREACEMILQAQGKLVVLHESYL